MVSPTSSYPDQKTLPCIHVHTGRWFQTVFWTFPLLASMFVTWGVSATTEYMNLSWFTIIRTVSCCDIADGVYNHFILWHIVISQCTIILAYISYQTVSDIIWCNDNNIPGTQMTPVLIALWAFKIEGFRSPKIEDISRFQVPKKTSTNKLTFLWLGTSSRRFSSLHGTAGAAALVVGTTFVAPTSGHLRVPHPKGWWKISIKRAAGRNGTSPLMVNFQPFLKDFRHIFPKKNTSARITTLEKNNHHNHHFWQAEVIFNRYQKSTHWPQAF